MSRKLDKKRNHDDDDRLFSYGNTMELAFGKKKFVGHYSPTNDESSDDESDLNDESFVVETDGSDNIDTHHNSKLSSEDEENDNKEFKSKTFDSHMMSPSPPPPPKLSNEQLANGNVKSSVRQLQSMLRSLKDDQPSVVPSYEQSTSRMHNVLVIDESPMAREIMVKVSCHGMVNKYKMKENERFANIQNRIAIRENVSKDKILLTLDQRPIESSDTLASIGYTVADIIQCLVLVSTESTSNGDDENVNKINIKLQTKDLHSKKQYSVLKTDALETVVKLYCEEKAITLRGVRVFFDGELVDLQQTPQDLDMDDENILDLIPV